MESFKATRIYQASAPAARVVSDMAGVRSVASELLGRRHTWGWATAASFIAMVALVFLAVISAISAVWAGAALALVLGIIFAVIYSGAKRQCLDERLYNFLLKILDLVGKDMAFDAPVKVRLDMQPVDDPANFTAKGKLGDWNVKFFAHPWLALEGKFLDGTTFDLEMTTRLQIRSKWARSRSGKTKRKTKRKESLRAYLKLWVRPQKYAHLAQLGQDAAQAIQLPPQAAVRRWNVAADSIELEAMAGEWDLHSPEQAKPTISAPHLAAMMFLSLYQVLNLCKAIDKTKPREDQA